MASKIVKKYAVFSEGPLIRFYKLKNIYSFYLNLVFISPLCNVNQKKKNSVNIIYNSYKLNFCGLHIEVYHICNISFSTYVVFLMDRNHSIFSFLRQADLHCCRHHCWLRRTLHFEYCCARFSTKSEFPFVFPSMGLLKKQRIPSYIPCDLKAFFNRNQIVGINDVGVYECCVKHSIKYCHGPPVGFPGAWHQRTHLVESIDTTLCFIIV